MGTLNRFTGKLVFVDTMPFIYHIEEHPGLCRCGRGVFYWSIMRQKLSSYDFGDNAW